MQLNFQREHQGRSNKYFRSSGMAGIAVSDASRCSAPIAFSVHIAKTQTPISPIVVHRLTFHLRADEFDQNHLAYQN